MNLIGVPVPPGFTITTDVCTEYYEMGQEKVVSLLKEEVEKAIANIENLMRSKFGDVENPLLVSVRSRTCIHAGYDGYDPESGFE